MIQLWEMLGRICAENGYVNSLLEHPPSAIQSNRKEHDQGFQDRVAQAGYRRMSRAELTEAYRLLKSQIFLDAAMKVGNIIRRFFPNPSKEEYQVLGLSTIDTTLQQDVKKDGGNLVNYGFPAASGQVLRNLLNDSEAEELFHILHLHWSPPDCICGLSFSDKYKHPLEGGTRDVLPGKPAPGAVLPALGGGSHPPVKGTGHAAAGGDSHGH
jgi:hypothetical protein